MGTPLSPPALAFSDSTPSAGRDPVALSNGMLSAFGRLAVPQSEMGAVPASPPNFSSSGSIVKSGFLASTTSTVFPAFFAMKASNSSSEATPPFLADMVTMDARRVDTEVDLALRSATRQKGIEALERACVVRLMRDEPDANIPFYRRSYPRRKNVRPDPKTLVGHNVMVGRRAYRRSSPQPKGTSPATVPAGHCSNRTNRDRTDDNHGLQPRREDPGVPRIHSRSQPHHRPQLHRGHEARGGSGDRHARGAQSRGPRRAPREQTRRRQGPHHAEAPARATRGRVLPSPRGREHRCPAPGQAQAASR
mmetsp:Transcript_11787/g.53199  ORF Transcript_11787/g.53199 Transcript_11787/m.53199 type:complete len:307 (+) Transcript_11787:218-1138(+)